MPGWIIQGVRGEGKSLCAVGKIKEYMLRGRPVATNLDLYLEKLLPEDNGTIAYRLPDHPRLKDFQLLPPAYDPKYKGEDMNGLLVLDELGTWLNSRSWNQKDRLEMLNWLFLSRKDHWDLILLAQDHEMIDSQVRTTLCDYLVQASRLDRQKIPYLAPLLSVLGFNAFMPRVHRYHVFYGLSTDQPPVETWNFTGRDFYNGYDTNQKFSNGMEALGGTLVDMRATYSYVPACYLTGQIFIDRLQQQIDQIRETNKIAKEEQGANVAKKKGLGKETSYLKIGILSVGLLIFVVWRLASGFSLPKTSAKTEAKPAASSSAPEAKPAASNTPQAPASSTPPAAASDTYKAIQTHSVIEHLLKTYRPRLSTTGYSPDIGFIGNVDFYDNFNLVETFQIKELHALGVSLVRKPYGADLIYDGKIFIVTPWRLPAVTNNQAVQGKPPMIDEPQLSGNKVSSLKDQLM